MTRDRHDHGVPRGGDDVETGEDGVDMDEKLLGVVGTFVLDRIEGLGRSAGSETLGGIAYSLASAVVSVPEGWTVLPIARVGVDAAPRVRRWLAGAGLPSTGLVECPDANNRVTLRYDEDGRRTEQLSGGVGGWSWDALAARVVRCDALLLNYISGHELDLETTRRLRAAFRGPIYTDLHSLFLGTEADGTRVPRPLEDWRTWLTCFDAVQMNEDEMDLLRGPTAVEATVRFALTVGPSVVVCTRGSEGASCWASPAARSFAPAVRTGHQDVAASMSAGDGGGVRYEIPTEPVDDADPTGCGDVFGGAMCARLLAGDGVEASGRWAADLAAVAAARLGVEGLVEEFRKRVEAM